MKETIRIILVGILGLCILFSGCSQLGCLEVRAASTKVTEEQLFYQCPAYLDNETANRREQYAHSVVENALEDVSKTDEILAAYMMGLQKGEEVLLNEYVLSKMGLSQSQYDKYVDDAIDIILDKYLLRNKQASEDASSVSQLYNKYLKKSYNIYQEVEKKQFTDDLKSANSTLTDAQVDSIVSSMMKDSSLNTINKYASEGIELWFLVATFVEMQEINLQTIDDLLSICASCKSLTNTDFHKGLLRYRENITQDIGSYMIDNWLKEKVINKVCGTIKKVGVSDFVNVSSATKLGASLTIEVIAWMYEQNHPTVKQIVEALILQNFMISTGNAVCSIGYDLRLADTQGTNKSVLKKQYIIAHDMYYTVIQCALNSAKKCTQDSDWKNICTKYENAFRNTWIYSEYINLCLSEAQKAVDDGSLVITSTTVSGGRGEKNENYYECIQAKFAEIQNHYPVESTWNGNWGGTIQCFGFARMVFSHLFGCEMPARYDSTRYQYTTDANVVIKGQLKGSSSEAQMKELMSKGQLGDIIQANGSSYGQHTMVFMSTTDTGVQVYDCNSHLHSGEGDCRIHQWVVTWSQLATWYNTGITLYHARNYENIYGDGTGMFYDDTVNFVVDENGVLTKYNGWQSFVEIPESVNDITVVAIGDGAFKGNKTMVSVSIPETVTSIGNSSFQGCTALAGIQVPNTVGSIGEGAFQNCENLEFAILPESTKYTCVNANTFYGCSSLNEISFPDNITMIDNGAFANCGQLKNVSFSPNIIHIGSSYYVTGAFANCSALQDVVLPSRLTFLGEGTFSGCTSLTRMIIPKTVTGTGYYAGVFSGCINLKTITFEEGMTTIPEKILMNSSYVQEIIIPDSVTSIGDNAFNGCVSMTDITLPENLTHIGNGSFAGWTKLETIQFPDSVTSIGSSYYVTGAFANCAELHDVVLPARLTFLGEGTFSGCTSLTRMIIPKTVTGTGYYAGVFRGCTNLKTITFEEGMSMIPEKILMYSNYVQEVVIPDSVNVIGSNAFSGCSSLQSIQIPDSVKTINSYAFSGCQELNDIILPSGIKIIPQSLFDGCTKLDNVILPNRIEKIGANAFCNCSTLESINVPESTKLIEGGAFKNCKSLTTLSIPDTTTEIGSYICDGCEELQTVSLGQGLKKIPQNAFSNCGKLESITIPYNVTTIEKDAFVNDTSLVGVTIPRKTTSIVSGVFSYPDKMVIYGVPGTYAEQYATQENIRFESRIVSATSVVLPQEEYHVLNYKTIQLSPTIMPNGFTDEISYKSSNTSVATVDENGLVRAQNVGMTTIKITVGNTTTSCKIIVDQPVTGIYLNQYQIALDGGSTYQLTAEIYPENAYNKAVEWSSSDENIATVDQNGKVTAKRKGSCQIYLRAKDGSEASDYCNVTVTSNLKKVSSIEELQSSHPYAENSTDIWEYAVPDVTSLSITFSEQTYVEEDFDFLYIYDVNYNEIGKFTGNQLSGQTVTVAGNVVRIKLETDGQTNAYGFKIDSVVSDTQSIYYTVKFDKNDDWATGGMSSLINCEYGKTYNLPSNKYVLEEFVFDSWNTKPDGTGVRYLDGASISNLCTTNGGIVTLYAQWVYDDDYDYDDEPEYHTHSMKKIVARVATCETAGNKQYFYCDGCDGYFWDVNGDEILSKSDTVIPATGHKNTEIRNKKKASVDAQGYTGDTYCKDCGKKIAAGRTIKAMVKNRSVIQPEKNKKKGSAATYIVTSTSKKTVTYKSCKSTAKSVTVPNTVKDANGKTYKVTAIGDGAFKNMSKVQTISIGNNVTKIGKDAFNGAKNVKSISLNGNALKTVGKKAFYKLKKNCKITILAKNQSQYKKVAKLISKSGAKNVKYIFKKKK